MAVSTQDFHELSQKQQEFLLEQVGDGETSTRFFSIDAEETKQVWFERLLLGGWVKAVGTSTFTDIDYEIPFEAWDVIAEVKAA